MWELDRKENWALKNWYFWTVVLEKTLESPLDSKINQSVLREVSPEYSLERLMLELKKVLWPPDSKIWLICKDPDAGKDWAQEEKGVAENEMVGWITNSMDMSLSKLWEMEKEREASCTVVRGVAKNWTQPSDWTTVR